MRHLILILGLFILCLPAKSQWVYEQEFSTDYDTISYTKLFELIENEPDTIFRLKHKIVKYDPSQDYDYSFISPDFIADIQGALPSNDRIEVNKVIELYNVQFLTELEIRNGEYIRKGVIRNIHFKKRVTIRFSLSTTITDCIFDEKFRIVTGNNRDNDLQALSDHFSQRLNRGIALVANDFHDDLNAVFTARRLDEEYPVGISISNNRFISKTNSIYGPKAYVFGRNIYSMNAYYNRFENYLDFTFNDIENATRSIVRNEFINTVAFINLNGSRGFDLFTIVENVFERTLILNFDRLSPSYQIDYSQFKDLIISREAWEYSLSEIFGLENFDIPLQQRDSLLSIYRGSERFKNEFAFEEELGLRGQFYNHYKARFNTEESNEVYVDIKNLETERFKFKYESNPTFETYFTLKINQFLKVFSDYGTKPAKAIVFSVYVILAFALVYLFFPNYWDSHGRNRIMDRYRFFTKYMKRDSGMHEVYLEEKNPELMASEDFKSYMLESEKGIPKFFMATALPLYRWSVAGTKSFSWMLSKVDVLKGKWSDTEDSKKGGKSILLIGAFLIALLYDIFIKVLNALMLSINTFTTLGFGEIPIKGLPRYLAIIQGFIGWFMLTIFSVSLISQLLN